ncbi:hypothetical protein B0H19DRAFT_107020 [Mycena capillaripes]|nr:hypothetical protein B0H19DRAFT_107020 [Mycena capillaripes]
MNPLEKYRTGSGFWPRNSARCQVASKVRKRLRLSPPPNGGKRIAMDGGSYGGNRPTCEGMEDPDSEANPSQEKQNLRGFSFHRKKMPLLSSPNEMTNHHQQRKEVELKNHTHLQRRIHKTMCSGHIDEPRKVRVRIHIQTRRIPLAETLLALHELFRARPDAPLPVLPLQWFLVSWRVAAPIPRQKGSERHAGAPDPGSSKFKDPENEKRDEKDDEEGEHLLENDRAGGEHGQDTSVCTCTHVIPRMNANVRGSNWTVS